MSDDRERERLNMPAGSVGIEEDFSETILQTATFNEGLKFWPWVNQVRVLIPRGISFSSPHRSTDADDSITATSLRDCDAAFQKNGV